jgi:endonuclease YncB( thermonuclease family)
VGRAQKKTWITCSLLCPGPTVRGAKERGPWRASVSRGTSYGMLVGEVVNKHGQAVDKVLVDEGLAKPAPYPR